MGKFLVIDGALGTQLESIIPANSPLQIKSDPLWSTKVLIEEPSYISRLHEQYASCGADILITSTYQASFKTLQKFKGMSKKEVIELWDKAVSLAKQAAGTKYIAGSIGPYGGYLANGSEYTGDYKGVTSRELTEYHLPSIHYFTKAGVDLIAFETIPNFLEFKVILNLLNRVYLSIGSEKFPPFYISFSMKSASQLADGTDIAQVSEYLNTHIPKLKFMARNLFALGCNCLDYQLVSPVLHNFNSHLDYNISLLTYPNLGMVYDHYDTDSTTYNHLSNLSNWQKLVKEWYGIENVIAIGGCCSTGPQEVKAVRDIVDLTPSKN